MRWALVLVVLLAGCDETSPRGEAAGSAGVDATGGVGGGAGQPGGTAGAGQPGGTAGQAGGGASAAGQAGQGGAAAACEPGEGVCVARVEGHAMTPTGAPLESTSVSVCGKSCFFGSTDAQGKFSVLVESRLLPETYALLIHGRPSHADAYVRLPALASVTQFPVSLAVPVFPGTGAPLPADDAPDAASVTEGPLTLQVPAGTTIELDLEDIVAGDEGRRLRVAPVAPAQSLFASEAVAVLALAPFAAHFSKPVAVSISGVSGLAEGQAVDLVVMDDDLLGDDGNRAGLPRVAATGHVQGGVVVSDAGQGLDRLTWLAVRAR